MICILFSASTAPFSWHLARVTFQSSVSASVAYRQPDSVPLKPPLQSAQQGQSSASTTAIFRQGGLKSVSLLCIALCLCVARLRLQACQAAPSRQAQFLTCVGSQSACFFLWLRMDMQWNARLCRDLLSCWIWAI